MSVDSYPFMDHTRAGGSIAASRGYSAGSDRVVIVLDSEPDLRGVHSDRFDNGLSVGNWFNIAHKAECLRTEGFNYHE